MAQAQTIDHEAFLAFVYHLRQRGFEIGTAQMADAQRLLLELLAKGMSPDQLHSYLGPLFCATPAEQEAFGRHYDEWSDRFVRPVGGIGDKKASGKESDAVLDVAVRDSRRALTAFLGLAVALVVAYFIWEDRRPRPVTVQFSSTPGGAAVVVDGDTLERATPFPEELITGTRKVSWYLPGFVPKDTTVVISQDTTENRFHASLMPVRTNTAIASPSRDTLEVRQPALASGIDSLLRVPFAIRFDPGAYSLTAGRIDSGYTAFDEELNPTQSITWEANRFDRINRMIQGGTQLALRAGVETPDSTIMIWENAVREVEQVVPTPVEIRSPEARLTIKTREPAVDLAYLPGTSTLVGLQATQLVTWTSRGLRQSAVPIASRDVTKLLAMSRDGSVYAFLGGKGSVTVRTRNGEASSAIDIPGSSQNQAVQQQALSLPSVVAASFVPSGKALTMVLDDGSVSTVTIDNYPQSTLGPFKVPISVAHSSDEDLMALGFEDGSAAIIDPKGQEMLRVYGHEGDVRGLAFNRTTRVLASGGNGGQVRLWDIRTGAELGSIDPGLGAISALAASTRGDLLAIAGERSIIQIWNMVDIQAGSRPLVVAPILPPAPPDDIRTEPIGALLAETGWEPDTNRHRRLEPRIGYAADSLAAAFGTFNGPIVFAHPDNQARRDTLWGHAGEVNMVRQSLDGRLLASVGTDSTVRVWWRDSSLIAERTVPSNQANSAPRNVVRAGNTPSRETTVAIGRHRGPATSVAIAGDGGWIVSAAADTSLVLWDIRTREAIQSVGASALGHDAIIDGLAVSDDGTRIASIGANGTIRTWEVSSTRFQAARNWVAKSGIWLLTLLGALAATGFALDRIFRSRVRHLQRQKVSEPPDITSIALRGVSALPKTGVSIPYVAQRMRRHATEPSRTFDVPATVGATVQHAGMFTPVLGSRKVRPEYLALIDRTTFGDHQTAFSDNLLDQLAANEVYITRYYFNGDARICREEDPRRRPTSLESLTKMYPDHRLLLFMESSVLFSPVTGMGEPWADTLLTWSERALFSQETTLDREAGRVSLIGALDVYPASTSGLKQFAERQPPESTGLDQSSALPPMELMQRPRRWVDDVPIPDEEVDRMMIALRNYLGDEGMEWLAACAIYPDIDWKLTLNLGHQIKQDDVSLITPERLSALSRLPWFRHAYMPDWFRQRLLLELDDEQTLAGRDTVARLLRHAASGSDVDSDLAIASKKHRRLRQFMLLNWMDAWKDRVAKGHPLRDHVFLTFMRGGHTDPLSVRVPRALQALLDRKPVPARVASDVRRLGLAAAGLIPVLVGAILLWRMIPPMRAPLRLLGTADLFSEIPSTVTGDPGGSKWWMWFLLVIAFMVGNAVYQNVRRKRTENAERKKAEEQTIIEGMRKVGKKSEEEKHAERMELATKISEIHDTLDVRQAQSAQEQGLPKMKSPPPLDVDPSPKDAEATNADASWSGGVGDAAYEQVVEVDWSQEVTPESLMTDEALANMKVGQVPPGVAPEPNVEDPSATDDGLETPIESDDRPNADFASESNVGPDSGPLEGTEDVEDDLEFDA